MLDTVKRAATCDDNTVTTGTHWYYKIQAFDDTNPASIKKWSVKRVCVSKDCSLK